MRKFSRTVSRTAFQAKKKKKKVNAKLLRSWRETTDQVGRSGLVAGV